MAGPFNWFSQVVSISAFNVRTLPQRLGSSLTAVLGVAGVVAVMVAVLSIAHGILRAMESSSAPENVVVLRSGATAEMMSVLGGNEVDYISEAPGIARNEAGAIASAELFVIIDVKKVSTDTDANVPLRGVTRPAPEVHQEFRIVEGRMFEWGLNEVIVGVGASREFKGLSVGDSIEVAREQWPIVGVFEAGGGISESEIWVDAAVLQPAYRRGTADPRLNVRPMREEDYYAEQSEMLYNLVTGLGLLIAVIMGFGAVFGALNTMYTAVAARAREIATLRALGFHSGPVVISVLIESLLLALTGGVIGAGLAWLMFDGFSAATLNWSSFSQLTFAFYVSVPLLIQGIVFALVIGFFGGLFPAVRAARLPVADALREQ